MGFMEGKRVLSKVATRKRDLEIEVSFLEGLIRRSPNDLDALRILGDDLTKLGRHDDSLKIDQKLAQLLPNDPVVHYNLACSYSLIHNYSQSVEELEKALDLGFSDFKQLRRDPDLKNLRMHPSFKKIREKIRVVKEKKKKL